MARIAVYFKRQLRLDRLNSTQAEMFELGNIALDSVKDRLRQARDANDVPFARLLYRGELSYPVLKAKLTGRPARRDYSFGFKRDKLGRYQPVPREQQLLPNLRIRTVSNRYAEARNSTEWARQKANRQSELDKKRGRDNWLSYSPANITETVTEARRLFAPRFKRMIVVKNRSGA